jgi:hypothetical protein
MIRRLPTGEIREQHRGTSATKLQGIVDRLQQQGFCGWVELCWPDCEGVLLLPGDTRVFPVFLTGATTLRGQDAMRHIIARIEQRPADVQVNELPPAMGALLGTLSGLEPLHLGLHTSFVDVRRLARRLERDGFHGMVVVAGSGWWAFLPYDHSGRDGIYYDGLVTFQRDREDLIDGLATEGAEIDVWRAPDRNDHSPGLPAEALPGREAAVAAAPAMSAPGVGSPEELPTEPSQAAGWRAFKGTDTFIVGSALRPDDPSSSTKQEFVQACGPLSLEVARALDGTRTLDQVVQAVGAEAEAVEPILLYLQQRKWMYRYVSRRGQGR